MFVNMHFITIQQAKLVGLFNGKWNDIYRLTFFFFGVQIWCLTPKKVQ